MKEKIKQVWRFFAWKDGKPSKTALTLSTSVAIAQTLWFVQSMFAGLVVKGFTIPEFDAGATALMLMTIFGLYIGNHKLKAKVIDGSITVEGTQGEEDGPRV